MGQLVGSLLSRGMCQVLLQPSTGAFCAFLQRVHGFEVMITRKAEGKTGKAFIGNMTEEKSVELASKIASESFLFVVSRSDRGAVYYY